MIQTIIKLRLKHRDIKRLANSFIFHLNGQNYWGVRVTEGDDDSLFTFKSTPAVYRKLQQLGHAN